ncbi:MAG: hypothetical protein AAF449_07375, partial [Myxococcota bacterium]
QVAGFRYQFDYTVVSGEVDGRYETQVSLTDLAGNVSMIMVPELDFTVDTVAPLAPAVDEPNRIVLTRRPWGTTLNGTRPQFDVVGAAGAVQSGAMVSVRHPFTGNVARVQADEAGAFTVANLPMPDAPSVSLLAIDDAGNMSPEVSVKDGRWIATFGAKRPGLTTLNPHRAELVNDLKPSLMQRGRELRRSQYQSLASPGGPVSIEAMQTWEDLTWRGGPGLRQQPGVAYDAVRGQLLLFGGLSETPLGDTWAFDGARWALLSNSGPVARRGEAWRGDGLRQRQKRDCAARRRIG